MKQYGIVIVSIALAAQIGCRFLKNLGEILFSVTY